MIKKIIIPVAALFCLLGMQVFADNHAMETPTIIDTYSCNFLDGKGEKDLDSAISYWNQQMDKMDNDTVNQGAHWLITPVRSSQPGDFYWLSASPNLTAWANGNAAYAASDEGQAADARFTKMSKCTSASWMSEQVYGDQTPPEPGATTILEAAGCTLKEGKTMSNVRAVEANFVAEAKAAGLDMRVFRFSPMYTNGEVDLLYFVGYNDTASYVANNNKGWNTKGLRVANAFSQLVMDCGAGLYNARNLRAPAAAE
jgi:hypothetical protein